MNGFTFFDPISPIPFLDRSCPVNWVHVASRGGPRRRRGDPVTIQQCFQTAARIQLLLRDLHAGLARCFGKTPFLRKTFIFLAHEEEQRAVRMRVLIMDRKGVLWSDEAIDTIRTNLVATLAELSAMTIEIRSDSGNLHPEPVLRRLIAMERRCMAIHAGTLARNSDPEVRAFFASLAKPDVRVERLLARALRSEATTVQWSMAAARPVGAHLAA
jgi:hypothetical protein